MTEATETGRRAAARAVRARRGTLGLSQLEVARRAGVDVKTIYNLETGERWPIARTLAAISAVLGLSLEHLLAIADGEPEKAAS